MSRPLVLIYQDLQQASVPPVTPDLNSVVVGPAYVLYDYPDDAATILLTSKYGLLESPSGTAGSSTEYVPPAAHVATVTVVAYPGNAPGAQVDHASVRVFLQNPHVVVGAATATGYGEQNLGTHVTTHTATLGSENLVDFTGGGLTLIAAGVQTGDRVIVTDSAGHVFVGTVNSVGEPDANGNITAPHSLRLTANITGTWTPDANGFARVERVLPSQEFVDTLGTVITFPTAGSDTLVINGGINVVVNSVSMPLSYAGIYLPYRALRQDLAGDVDFVSQSDVLIDSVGRTFFAKIGLVDARNPLAAGTFTALQNAGAAPVYFFGVQADSAGGYTAARAVTEARRDLWAFALMTTDLSIIGSFKLEWDQLADPSFALTNGVPQKFRCVIGSTTLPLNSTISPSSVTGVTSAAGTPVLTGLHRTLEFHEAGIDVTQVVAGDLITLGLVPAGGSWATRRGTHTVSHLNQSEGIPGGDHPQLEILPGTSRWDDANTDSSGNAEILITDSTGTVVKVSKLATLSKDSDESVPSGNAVLYAATVPTVQGGPYTIIYTASAPTSTPVISIAGFAISIQVQFGTTTLTQIMNAVNTDPVLSQLMTASIVGVGSTAQLAAGQTAESFAAQATNCQVENNDAIFTWLFDATATFLSAGVKAGDIVQIPIDPNDYSPGAFGGPILSYAVAQVISESRLAVQTLGDDTPSADNELPHYYNRHLPNRYIDDETVSSASAIRYQVVRALTSDDQVSDLIAVAQSVSSKRCVIVWPDLCDVDGLKDGSLPRFSTPLVPAPAASQSGAYIACQIAGALAGLPVQQGLTNLGLAGITKIYHSTRFFREAQLSRLSDGGLLVMQQLAPDALPEAIHQLTTDPTAVETGELSVVRNIDFVSISAQEIVEPFLGQWNVLPETLSAILSDVNKEFVSLQNRKVARIGAPLVSGTVTSLVVDPSASNRVVMMCNIKVAEPLNGADVHLVI